MASFCFKNFLSFMVNQWGYLLSNNFDYWVPMLDGFAESIRLKCRDLGVLFPEDFNICAFTDNTMNATCRAGGGSTNDGVFSPRNDPNIQRAWYNGWKKLHGLKWQTIDLPNGMNGHVWGPVSVRHNDLWTLQHSNLNDVIRDAQVGRRFQFNIYGDSAYMHLDASHIRARHNYTNLTDREKVENRVMSSVRECIEWNYGELVKYFPLLKWKMVLKIRQMPVGDIYLTSMIFRNAFNCLKPGQTSQYFRHRPPTLDHWLAQGPNARPHIVPVIDIPP
jgi:hypothetical protein